MELNKIYCMDNLEGMAKLPDNFAKLTITSPPYNVGMNNMAERCKKKYGNGSDNIADYYEWLVPRFAEMVRVSETVFFNIQMLSDNKSTVLEILSDYKDYLKDIIVWGKHNPQPAMEEGVLNSSFEFIFIFSKNRPEKRKFYDCSFRGTVSNLIMTSVYSINRFSKIHRAVFPLQIPTMIIENFSKEGDIILDPFMGLGTVGVAAVKANRKYLGFEVNPDYVKAAEERIVEETAQQSIFSLGVE